MRALEYLLNFRTNKASLGSANQDVKSLRENITGIGTTFNKVHGELTKFANSQKWMNITQLSQNVLGGVGGIAGKIKKAFTSAYNFMDEFASEGDKVAKTARLIGMSVKDFQAFSFAADRSGVSLEQFNSGMQRFSITLGKARSGDKTANQMLSALLPKELAAYKDERELLLDLSDSYTKLSESQRNFVSQSIFGRTGVQFGEMLSSGSAGVEALLQRFEDLGGGFGDEAAKNAETFKDSLTDMNVTLNSMRVLVGSELLPVFNQMFGEITKYFVANRMEIQSVLRDFGSQFVGGVKKLIPMIPDILGGVKTIFGYVADIVEFLGPIKTILGVAIIGSLGSIIGIVTSLVGLIGGPAVAAIAACAVGFGGLASAVLDIYKNCDMLVSFVVDDVVPWIKGAFNDFFSFLSDGIENSIASGAVRALRKLVKMLPGGNLIFSDVDFGETEGDIGGEFAKMVEVQQKSSTTTNRFSVDFKNMPRGVKVQAPKQGDFDYSYGYVLDGGV